MPLLLRRRLVLVPGGDAARARGARRLRPGLQPWCAAAPGSAPPIATRVHHRCFPPREPPPHSPLPSLPPAGASTPQALADELCARFAGAKADLAGGRLGDGLVANAYVSAFRARTPAPPHSHCGITGDLQCVLGPRQPPDAPSPAPLSLLPQSAAAPLVDWTTVYLANITYRATQMARATLCCPPPAAQRFGRPRASAPEGSVVPRPPRP